MKKLGLYYKLPYSNQQQGKGKSKFKKRDRPMLPTNEYKTGKIKIG